MRYDLPPIADFLDHGFDDVIDVRSPSEYAEDHVPGAISLPVLDDEERARVGTVYVQQSAFLARKIGAALVARNAARHIEGPLADRDGGWQPLVYCWRGGQRSNSFATILSQVGWRTQVVAGGYQSWRRSVKALLYDTPFPAPVVLLDGDTGTAKTDILLAVGARGGQVLDLEGLARHRGSLFGHRAGGQPAQKAFETALAQRIARLDPARPVLVEAESSKVGDLNVPPRLWAAMRAAPRITVSAPLDARADYLMRAYDDIVVDADRLDATLASMKRLQGAETVDHWRALARDGELRALARELMERHYDPRYRRQRDGGAAASRGRVETARLDPTDIERLAGEVLSLLLQPEPA